MVVIENKNKGITDTIRIHPLGVMNVYPTFSWQSIQYLDLECCLNRNVLDKTTTFLEPYQYKIITISLFDLFFFCIQLETFDCW